EIIRGFFGFKHLKKSKIMGRNRNNGFYSFRFCDESGVVIDYIGHRPVFKLSELLTMKNMIDKSIEKYLSEGITDKMVDYENKEIMYDYAKENGIKIKRGHNDG